MSINKDLVEKHVRSMLSEGLGLNLEDPNLKDTPERIARMYCNELFRSFTEQPPLLRSFPNEGFDEIILFDNIPYISLCSHHFMPFHGKGWLLYIPDKELMGASKSARALHYFADAPQLQERLGIQVVDYICKNIKPKGVMLVMRAVHGCMACRGVRTGFDAGMTTSITRGAFRDDPSTRAEAMSLIQLSILDRGN